MLLGIATPSKQPGETWVLEVDFTNDMDVAGGETIQTATATSLNRGTGVASTSTFLVGQSVIAGRAVRIRVAPAAGLAGDIHRVQFTIQTAAPYSNTTQHEIDVPVEDYSR